MSEELRWLHHESWLKERLTLQTLFIRGIRSDGAVFTVAASVSEHVGHPERWAAFDRLESALDGLLARPMAHGDAFQTGRACGYRV